METVSESDLSFCNIINDFHWHLIKLLIINALTDSGIILQQCDSLIGRGFSQSA
jgi:hypothetical protein